MPDPAQAHSYVASVDDLRSNAIEVSAEEWVVNLASDSAILAAGRTAALTATTNQDLSNTNHDLELFIFNVTTGGLVASCSSGSVCSARTDAFYQDDTRTQTFVAVVGRSGSPSTPDDVVDPQGTSSLVSVYRAGWQMDIVGTDGEVSAGDTVHIGVTVDQDLSDTNGLYAIHIFDVVTDTRVAYCTTGASCQADILWDASSPNGASYVAFVASAGTSPHVDALENVQYARGSSVSSKAWQVSLASNKTTAAAGESTTITATANQNVGLTGGKLALYIVEWAQGTIVRTCTTGVTCTVDDFFYKDSDAPYAAHSYQAIVGEPGATDPYAIQGSRARSSENVRVDSTGWTMGMDLTASGAGRFQFTATTNQNLTATNGQLGVYLWNSETGQLEDTCFDGDRCLLTAQHNSQRGYYAALASRPPTLPATASDLRSWYASTAISWEPESGGPVIGPVLPGESMGGGNPAEKGCQCAHADPVNSATGEFYENLIDLSIPGTGPALHLTRSYSSAAASDNGAFGFGWTGNVGTHLRTVIEPEAPGDLPRQVEIVQENGATVLFTRSDAGDYQAPDRVNATLAYDVSADAWIFVRDFTLTFTLNAEGQLLDVADAHGNKLAYTHDAEGHVASISASGGRNISLLWQDGRIARASDSAGRTTSYEYNLSGDLVAVIDPAGSRVTYDYSADHKLVTQTSPIGGSTVNIYDSTNRVVSQMDPVGRTTTFAYTYPGFGDERQTTITKPDGSATVEIYRRGLMVSQTSAADTADSRTTTLAYDSSLNVTSATDAAGATTGYTYNAAGRKLSETNPLGHTSHWVYNSHGDVTAQTDALGRETTYEYNESRDLVESRSAGNRVIKWTHRPDGLVATEEDARGETTSYAYTLQGWLSSTEDPGGNITTFEYNAAGKVTSTTNAVGATTSMTVDRSNRYTGITNALGATTQYAYDAAGNLTSSIDPVGATTTTTYDLAGQKSSSTDPHGTITDYAYSATGNLTSVTSAGTTSSNEYDVFGQQTTSTDGLGRSTHYSYDKAGRLANTTLPSGSTRVLEYDVAGQVVRSADGLGRATLITYDEAGQPIANTDPLGRTTRTTYTPDGEPDATTFADESVEKHEYGPTGAVSSFHNADGKKTSYSYDSRGQLLAKTEPGGLRTAYTYDAGGQLSSLTKPDGTAASYTYDAAGQLTGLDFHGSTVSDAVYVYDAAGRRTSMADATGNSTYEYDIGGRPVRETNGAGATLRYAYNQAGQLERITYPGDREVLYEYDHAGQTTKLTDWEDRTTEFRWDLDGHLASQAAPNGVTQARSYDAAGQTTAISTSTAADVLSALTYDYDAAGQVIADRSVDSITAANAYSYDRIGQLTGVDNGTTPGSYAATPAGLLTSTALDGDLTYNAAQQLTAFRPADGPETLYGYDANGSRTSASTAAPTSASAAYAYSPAAALASVTLPTGESIAYTADGDGLRQSRTSDNTTVHFLWSTASDIPLLLDDGESTFIYGPTTTPIAQVDKDSGRIGYLHTDLLGTPETITSDTGAVVGRSTYDEYGIRTGHTGTDDTSIGYTGNLTDSATGLVYLRARDYDSVTKQFLTVDPAVDITKQPYAYVGNSPLLNTDPTGLCSFSTATSYCGKSTVPIVPSAEQIRQVRGDAALDCQVAQLQKRSYAQMEPWQRFLYDSVVRGQQELHRAVQPGLPLLAMAFGGGLGGRAANTVGEIRAVAASARPAALTVSFGHGARHLEGTNLSAAAVESAIERHLAQLAQGGPLGGHYGEVVVDGTTIQYRAFPLTDDSINVGTYYVPKPSESILKQ
jgi:RHS repeat-associated protein